jgi:transcription antitermination protein NusB
MNENNNIVEVVNGSDSVSLNSKSISRIIAVQCIYCFFLEEKNSESLRDIFNRVRSIYYDKEDMIDTFEIEKDLNFDYKINSVYSRGIFETCVEKADYIDQIISSYLIEKRTISDMNLIIACILRAAISESIIYKDLPYRVIIKEYTDIAREFCSQIGEVNFVNSILDKITKKLNAQ